ncbi:hypothetical protein CPB85DRAFT_1429680 [Mucidula mucida]|nr:hypothetical protein CPB85DRAFT_1429680 [Mucidula mucida]
MTRLLLTGASGYLGAELLPHILGLPDLEVYALVRSDAQAEALSGMGIIPVRFDLTDQAAIINSVEENTITVVFHLADAFNFAPAEAFINGLASVKAKTSQPVHFLHTSGAKIFSSHAGIHRRLCDDEDIYTVQKTTEPAYAFMKTPVETCTSIHELGDSLGVNTYIFVPPMVYGPRSGFGNKISIQYVDIIRIALQLRTVYQVADPFFEWPSCHVQDVASLYALIAKAIHEKKTIPHGRKDGYFFAVNGEYKWKDLYQGIANSLASRSLIDSNALSTPTDDDLERMAEVLGKGPKPLVDISVGGSCALTASNGAALGWTPQYGVDHLLSTIDAEVQFILDNLK